MRVLIVEDDPSAATMMEDALTRAGHQPVSYGHGGLALGAIVRGNFELLICDLLLPNNNGVEVIKMIRGQFPFLPVIVVSGLEAVDWEVLCRKAGATCYLQKPVRMERLLREVKLVEQSQVKLDVGIIDGDRVHSSSLGRQLGSMGCTVAEWQGLAGMLAAGEKSAKLSVLLVDATLEDAPAAIEWANGKSMAVVAFQADGPGFDQDKLMRLGASFCLAKPVDAVSLVTQARFFVAPSGGGMGF